MEWIDSSAFLSALRWARPIMETRIERHLTAYRYSGMKSTECQIRRQTWRFLQGIGEVQNGENLWLNAYSFVCIGTAAGLYFMCSEHRFTYVKV
jgi:hypothetical protein